MQNHLKRTQPSALTIKFSPFGYKTYLVVVFNLHSLCLFNLLFTKIKNRIAAGVSGKGTHNTAGWWNLQDCTTGPDTMEFFLDFLEFMEILPRWWSLFHCCGQRLTYLRRGGTEHSRLASRGSMVGVAREPVSP